MEVIPAIDLLAGRCVRLYQGDYEQSQVFSENPLEIALQWQSLGATRLHLVDLDGAKEGTTINLDAISTIVKNLNIPIQVGGGLRDRTSIERLFDLGVERAIVGTVAVEKPELVEELCNTFPHKIAVGIDARNGKVATKGWLETSTVEATDLAQRISDKAAAIIYTDISRDGTLVGPNIEALKQLAQVTDIPVIASGGISSLTDLLSLVSLESLGVRGVIVGKAIYTGKLDLKEAIQAIGNGRLQDIPPDIGNSTLV
ncbi:MULTISPECIES: 1-(5-phosphoribosyl)-5-[(5-phosphoribosylamino)methylideneamino]imidazole-4-carboxamide isomerase [Cyanobacterium]|uniref:1-(5-phosphoribosyl)-5-[(5- phosphoribosylamino)methylideneamino]imidazole-4- carboxamide isomerase n=1 Tax=Cyanobacterium TaxID=102234 RepID=UPI000C12CB54|nr:MULTISPECIES: 1-(5-phosphoribosyl)-5-[(5-phosphoribosylamino)methylideneamino]imidazole-4-carboxamide isomerase [Cyanobacterium]PHV61716.1 1-(5-phosphoribosyl)-5-[(5-phosphoribosylamino)methylideneamino]imidazole-4-carboxamide isomerase [Cyanobacterium aponinum IPPAS B-1201]WVL01443.1 1-(5-phosphoribosyl)-5-[(5-phosphoribosylamino)methylideneamino]imidazole-4-carboxamide isomerase [Cyanobacterium sp. Dongsha4]